MLEVSLVCGYCLLWRYFISFILWSRYQQSKEIKERMKLCQLMISTACSNIETVIMDPQGTSETLQHNTYLFMESYQGYKSAVISIAWIDNNTIQYITPHYTPIHYTTLIYITPNFSKLQNSKIYYTKPHLILQYHIFPHYNDT